MSNPRRGSWCLGGFALMAACTLAAPGIECDPEETVQRRLDSACIVPGAGQDQFVVMAHEYLMRRRSPAEEFFWLDRYPLMAGVPQLDGRQYFLLMWHDLSGADSVLKEVMAGAGEDFTLLTMELRYSADIINYHRYLSAYQIPLSRFAPTRCESQIPQVLRWRLKNTIATRGRAVALGEFWDPRRGRYSQFLLQPTRERTVWIGRDYVKSRHLVIEYNANWTTRRSWTCERKPK